MNEWEKQNERIKKLLKKQNKKAKGVMTRQNKIMKKALVKAIISKEGRVRIPTKRKQEVEKKYNNKCAVCKKKPLGVTLQIHHKNGKNSDNKLPNLVLLCPNHHTAKHSKGSKLNKTIRRRGSRNRSLI